MLCVRRGGLHLDLDKGHVQKDDQPVFKKARKWLDIYFAGKQLDAGAPLHFIGSAFQNEE
ncbi:MAG: hypothetical protein VZT48_01885 [Bulleidia sp.]|nr:hypothetical protein [Bulleidia sp.]